MGRAGASMNVWSPWGLLTVTGSPSRDQIWKDVQLGRGYHSPPLLPHLPPGAVPSEGIAHPPIVSPPHPLHSCYSDEERLGEKVVQREVLGDRIGDKGLGCPGEVAR